MSSSSSNNGSTTADTIISVVAGGGAGVLVAVCVLDVDVSLTAKVEIMFTTSCILCILLT